MNQTFVNGKLTIIADASIPKENIHLIRAQMKGKGKKAVNMTKAEMEPLVVAMAAVLEIEIS